MPRRRYNRKRVSKKRTYRRRWTRRTRYNKRGQKLYLFKRYTGIFGVATISNVSPTFISYNFSLRDLPNYQEFTNLYDQYKINAVKISFIPQMTQSVSIGSINNPAANARFFSVIDYNDDTPLTSIDDAREYASCKYTPILRTHKRYLKPRLQDRGATYTPGRPWVNCTSPEQDYYGVKIAVEPMGSTTTQTMAYSVEAVYYLSFKNVK